MAQAPAAGGKPAVVDLSDVKRMREQVESRRAEEDEQYGTGGGDGGGGEITSKFVRYCLEANELGDGELYCRMHRDRFVYDKAAGHWMVWAGHHWQIDRMDESRIAVEDLVPIYLQELERLRADRAKLGADDDQKRAIIDNKIETVKRRIHGLRSTRRRTNCLTMAHTCRTSLAISGEEIDRRPWLLPCANGVVDLTTGESHPGRREDWLCKASPIEWMGIDADATPWETALLEILAGNEDLVAYLRRSLGMALIGEVMNSAFFVWTGAGRNGKSVIAETTCGVLGPLAGTIRSEMLLDQGRVANASGPTPQIMHLRGLRIAFASETDDGCKISPSQVKWLTGRDQLVGRNPHDKYEVQFDPTHTLFLLTNHKPQAPVDDFAFWERMQLVPFGLSFVNREPREENERRADPQLPHKLKACSPGILAWLVRGCLEFQRHGMQPPPAVLAATEEYKRDEDLLADFIAECLEVTDSTADKLGATQGHEVFTTWWKRRVSGRAPSLKRFGGWMKKRFKFDKQGTVSYLGVRLSTGGQTYLDSGDGSWS